MARLKTFREEEVVQKAMELFWEKGYEETSLADLTDRLGIGKGSFYATFKSKEALFNRCIEQYTEANFPFLDQELNKQKDFRQALKNLLEAYVEGLLKGDNRKGCLMANSCSLVHDGDSIVGDRIAQHYQRIEANFMTYLKHNGLSDKRAKAVSSTIITFLIGASQQSKVNRNKRTYLNTIENIIHLLD